MSVLSNGEGLSGTGASLNFWLHVENQCGHGHTKKIKGYDKYEVSISHMIMILSIILRI